MVIKSSTVQCLPDQTRKGVGLVSDFSQMLCRRLFHKQGLEKHWHTQSMKHAPLLLCLPKKERTKQSKNKNREGK